MAVDVSALVARFGGGRVSGIRERKDAATTLQTDTQVVAQAVLATGDLRKSSKSPEPLKEKNTEIISSLETEGYARPTIKAVLKRLGLLDGAKSGTIDLSESIDSIQKLLNTPARLHTLQEEYGEPILRASLEELNLLEAFDSGTLLLSGTELKDVRQACRQRASQQQENNQIIDTFSEQGFSRKEVRSVVKRLGISDDVKAGNISLAPRIDEIKQIIHIDRWMAHLEHEFGSELVQTILERHTPDQTELLRSPEQLEVIQTECTERNQKQFNICKARFLSLQIPEEKNPQAFLELKAKLERISPTSLSAEDQKFLRNALCLLNSLENFKSRLTDAFDTMIFDWSETIKDLYGDRTLELIKLYKHMDPSQVKDSFINSHLVTFLTEASHAAVIGDLPEEFGQKTEAVAIKHQSEIDTHLLDLMNSYGRYHEWVGKYQQYIIAPYNQGNESAGKIGFGICYTLSVHSARELLQNPDIPSEELSVGFTRDVQSLHRDFKLNKSADSLHQKAGIKPVLEGLVKFRPGDAQKKIRACSPMFDRSYGPRVGIFHVEDSKDAGAISHTVLLQMDHSKNRFIDAGCGLVDFGDDRETCIEAFSSYLSLVYWGLDKMSFTLFEHA